MPGSTLLALLGSKSTNPAIKVQDHLSLEVSEMGFSTTASH
jgi:hypothetical protein